MDPDPYLFLTEWQPDPSLPLPDAFTRRLPDTSSPIAVYRRGTHWAVKWFWTAPTDPIEGCFTAPSKEVACRYADDALHALGFTGPGLEPLPAGWPRLRGRTPEIVPVRGQFPQEGARCACGHAAPELLDQRELCPTCGGAPIITSLTLTSLGIK